MRRQLMALAIACVATVCAGTTTGAETEAVAAKQAAELKTAKRAARDAADDMVLVVAAGWRPKEADPEKVARVWNLPVRFTSFEAMARLEETARLEMGLERPVTLDFADTPVRDVLTFLQDFTGIGIVVDPNAFTGAGPGITLKVRDMALEKALSYILKFAGGEYQIVDGAIIVVPRGASDRREPIACDAPDSPALRKLAGSLMQETTLDFADTPLRDVVRFINDAFLKDISIVLDLRGLPKERRKVTMKTKAIPLSSMLDLLLRQAGLQVQIVGDLMLLTPDPATFLKGGGQVHRVKADDLKCVTLHTTSPRDAAMAKALAKPTTLDFADTPIRDVITFLQNSTGVNMVLDPNAVEGRRQTITLKVLKMPLRDALAAILDQAGLGYAIRGDALFISNPEGLGRCVIPGWTPEPYDARHAEALQTLQERLEKPVTLDFADTPLRDVVAFLQDFTGINMMIDPLAKGCRELPVTLKVKECRLDTALGAIAYLCDMRVIYRRGLVMFTTEDAGWLRLRRGLKRQGAGVVVAPGYVLTRLETVEQAAHIRVAPPNRSATIVDVDQEAGTALLKLEGKE